MSFEENLKKLGEIVSELEKNDISKLLNNMPSDNKTYFIYDSNQDKIVSANDKTLMGLSDADIAYDLDLTSKKEHLKIEIERLT